MREFELIDWLRTLAEPADNLLAGIGDDCAVFRIADEMLLATTDMLVEGVHYTKDDPPELVGRKLLTVSISDIAAMGGIPLFALVSTAFAGSKTDAYIKALAKSLFTTAKKFQIAIIGGDTTGFTPATDGAALSLTLLGKMQKNIKPVMRSTAEVGDIIAVTGTLGNSLQTGKHLNFEPRIKEGQFLAEFGVNSMIDISDGLSGDLNHVLAQSEKGALIYEDKIPASPSLLKTTSSQTRAKQDSTKLSAAVYAALNDGEDFELLFTFDANRREELAAKWQFATELSFIGEIKPAEFRFKIQLANKKIIPVKIDSWQHLQKNSDA